MSPSPSDYSCRPRCVVSPPTGPFYSRCPAPDSVDARAPPVEASGRPARAGVPLARIRELRTTLADVEFTASAARASREAGAVGPRDAAVHCTARAGAGLRVAVRRTRRRRTSAGGPRTRRFPGRTCRPEAAARLTCSAVPARRRRRGAVGQAGTRVHHPRVPRPDGHATAVYDFARDVDGSSALRDLTHCRRWRTSRRCAELQRAP